MQSITNPPETSNNKVLTAIRNATAGMHDALEHTALARSIGNPSVTMIDYYRYLEAMKAVMSFTENSIFPQVKNIIADMQERYKLPLIQKDLDWLHSNYQVTADGYEFNPVQEPFDTGFALGFMYVTEGSTLGGLYILKQLRNVLVIDENDGGSFFYGYGNLSRQRWNYFLSVMESFSKDETFIQQAVAGAICAFTSIHKFFESILKQ